METSSACFRTLSSPSSILFSSFSDQSHLDFYLHRSSSLPFPSLRSGSSSSSWLPSASPLRALCESAQPPLLEPASEQNFLMKELADLKLQLKQKKKELKLQTKGEKKKLKLQMKEGKKTMKQDCKEDKKKVKKCQSESSSSSESSDGECESMSMGMLRQEHSLQINSEAVPVTAQLEENCRTRCERSGAAAAAAAAIMTEAVCIGNDKQEVFSSQGKMLIFNGEASLTYRELPSQEGIRQSTVSSSRRLGLNSSFTQAPNRIEVCAGGKCKKAGSEKLLLALDAQIPSSSDVVAVPCKCMGKCSMAMNVKVHKEGTNLQHHSHVRVEDANLLLNHHFGLRRPPSGLPSLPSQTRVPLTMSR